jgi:hypothetical protein
VPSSSGSLSAPTLPSPPQWVLANASAVTLELHFSGVQLSYLATSLDEQAVLRNNLRLVLANLLGVPATTVEVTDVYQCPEDSRCAVPGGASGSRRRLVTGEYINFLVAVASPQPVARTNVYSDIIDAAWLNQLAFAVESAIGGSNNITVSTKMLCDAGCVHAYTGKPYLNDL